MKRFYLLVLVLLTGLSVQAKNKINMVTYFPVPYVAFPQIASRAQMDIGLTQSCDMTLGCTSSETTLFSPDARLTNGRLNLNGGLGILGGSLALGAGSSTGSLQFKQVRFQTAAMTSMVAGSNTLVSRQLILFTKTFPSCKGVGNGTMRWEKLKLSGAGGEELYLVCGESTATPPALDCSDYSYKLSHKSECCPSTSTSDSDCWVQSCNYKWVDDHLLSVVAGRTGYDNIGNVNSICGPEYYAAATGGNMVSYSGGPISESKAADLLGKANFNKCSSQVLGNSCGAHQENEHCYHTYSYSETNNPPCRVFTISTATGLTCKKECTYQHVGW